MPKPKKYAKNPIKSGAEAFALFVGKPLAAVVKPPLDDWSYWLSDDVSVDDIRREHAASLGFEWDSDEDGPAVVLPSGFGDRNDRSAKVLRAKSRSSERAATRADGSDVSPAASTTRKSGSPVSAPLMTVFEFDWMRRELAWLVGAISSPTDIDLERVYADLDGIEAELCALEKAMSALNEANVAETSDVILGIKNEITVREHRRDELVMEEARLLIDIEKDWPKGTAAMLTDVKVGCRKSAGRPLGIATYLHRWSEARGWSKKPPFGLERCEFLALLGALAASTAARQLGGRYWSYFETPTATTEAWRLLRPRENESA